MQYFFLKRRKKNDRFRVSITLNEALPPFGRELALGLPLWSTLIIYCIKKIVVLLFYSQTALDVNFS